MPTELQHYRSLEEICLRKEMLLKDIQKDDQQIMQLWHGLFHKPVALRQNATPSKRIGSLMSTGAGILDGIILGWKLYRKFKK